MNLILPSFLLFLFRQLKNLQLQIGIDYYQYETIPSTNDQVWELIDSGKKLPLVVVATQQTAGKGQRGNKWLSNKGGLYLSMGLEVNLPVDYATHLTLWSVWGIAHNLRKNQIPVKIKWLNDLILNGYKLGGILTETRVQNNLIKKVVIGVGINWQNEVPPIGINIKSVIQNQPNSKIKSLEDLAIIVCLGILNGYNYYMQKGSEKLIKSYEEILDNLGQKILVENMVGMITGISHKGALKVKFRSQGASTEVLFPFGSIRLGYESYAKSRIKE